MPGLVAAALLAHRLPRPTHGVKFTRLTVAPRWRSCTSLGWRRHSPLPTRSQAVGFRSLSEGVAIRRNNAMRFQRRTKPTMSLTAFMVSAASDLRARGAVGEHRIDMGGIGDQPLHLGVDRPELGDREIDQRGLEGRELRAAELARAPRPCSSRRAPHRCRRDCRPPVAARGPSPRSAAAPDRSWRVRILCAIASASSVRLMRDWSEASDFDIFLVPSRSDITRVAGPWISGSGCGKNASPIAMGVDRRRRSRC